MLSTIGAFLSSTGDLCLYHCHSPKLNLFLPMTTNSYKLIRRCLSQSCFAVELGMVVWWFLGRGAQVFRMWLKVAGLLGWLALADGFSLSASPRQVVCVCLSCHVCPARPCNESLFHSHVVVSSYLIRVRVTAVLSA